MGVMLLKYNCDEKQPNYIVMNVDLQRLLYNSKKVIQNMAVIRTYYSLDTDYN